jgi:hypothetical protein
MQVLKLQHGMELVVIRPRPIAMMVAAIYGGLIPQPFVYQRRSPA